MNVLIGAKLGDFINSLMVPARIYETTGQKSVILIHEAGDVFSSGIKKTFQELQPILAKQPFVEDFKIYGRERLDYNLVKFRFSPLIFRASWPEIFFKMMKEAPQWDYKWLNYDVPPTGNIVMNRSLDNMSRSTINKYHQLLEEHKGVKFIFSDPVLFKEFPLKDLVEPVLCTTLSDVFTAISGASLYIGNQSSPLAIASSLSIPRIAELRKGPDQPHYREDKSTKLSWFIGE